MSQMLCSIIIATRRRMAWLQQCLGSVLSQKGVDFEVIVVNDASTDQTAEWLDGFADPRLCTIHFPVPRERAAARNAGLEKARGQLAMFLDDDDQLWPGALQALSAALLRHPLAVAAVGARQAWFVEERFRRREPHPRREMLRDVRLEAIFGWCPTGGQVLLRTEAVRSVGGYNGALVPCEDRFLWQRLSLLGKFALIPETVLTYRQHPQQKIDKLRAALRERVARMGIAGLPKNLRRRALMLRRAKGWFDQSEKSLMDGLTVRGIHQACRGLCFCPEAFFSPLLGEWVVRWLVGRGLRFYLPAQKTESEGVRPDRWKCSPSAWAFIPGAPIVPPGIKAHPILVQTSGGVGNQLFQHAAAQVLSSQTGSVALYIPTDSPWRSRDPGLELFLGPLPRAGKIDLLRFGLPPFNGFPKLRRFWRNLANRVGFRRKIWKTEGGFPESIEAPLFGNGILLAGFFQSLDWVEGALDCLIAKLLERKPTALQVRPEVIAINLRTGRDYEGNGWVLPQTYYLSVLQELDPMRAAPLWVTGDIEGDIREMSAKLRHDGWLVEPPPVSGGHKMIDDFWNMASAGTLVMSNSTFAWWAAAAGDFLHEPNAHRVIFPEPWTPGMRENLRRSTWIPKSIAASD